MIENIKKSYREISERIISLEDYSANTDGDVDNIELKITKKAFGEFDDYCLNELLKLRRKEIFNTNINEFRKIIQPEINKYLISIQKLLQDKFQDSNSIACGIKVSENIIYNNICNKSELNWNVAEKIFPYYGIPYKYNQQSNVWSVIWPKISAQQSDASETMA